MPIWTPGRKLFRQPLPSEPVRIAPQWSDRFVYAVIGTRTAVVPGLLSGQFSMARNSPGVVQSTTGPLRGRRFVANGGGDTLNLGTLPADSTGNVQPSYLAVVYAQTPQAFAQIICHADRSGLIVNSTGLNVRRVYASAGGYNNLFSPEPALTNNATNVIVATARSVGSASLVGNHRIVVNGTLFWNTTADYVNYSQAIGGASLVGQDSYGTSRTWVGTIPLVAVWNRTLSDDEMYMLSADPWQIFEPIRRAIFFAPAAAGGNIVSVSVVARATGLRGADAVSPTRSTVAASRIRLRGADAVAPIKATGIVARAARLRGIDAVSPTRSTAIIARGARLRSGNQAAPGGIVVVNVVARAARMRSSDSVTALRAVTVQARAARLRGADGVAPTKTGAVTSRAARLRSGNQAAPGGITIVNIVARAARMRAGATVTATRAVAVQARAARLRGTDGVITTKTRTIAARGARFRGTVTATNASGPTILVTVAARAARLRVRDVAYPLGPAPASSKSLSAQTPRLGGTPADVDAGRLGLSPAPTGNETGRLG